MENGNGNVVGVGGSNHKISSDDVISKLKDDGDFDRLRLMIIRKLKENEELRSNIVSTVKQSVAINRPGAEKMKPRQLSDAIHQEVGVKLNEQISDVLWEIIRSPDGMEKEITETVKSVYDILSRPKRTQNGESLDHGPKRNRNASLHHTANVAATNENNDISENEPNEPLGLSQTASQQIDVINPTRVHNLPIEKQENETIHGSHEVLKNNDTQDTNQVQGDGSDEDPDAPPGFG
ncbi:hypothetical protein R6Q57_012215 [Mikania cordata]